MSNEPNCFCKTLRLLEAAVNDTLSKMDADPLFDDETNP